MCVCMYGWMDGWMDGLGDSCKSGCLDVGWGCWVRLQQYI